MPGVGAPARLIFLRDFRVFSGGHLKVWHYFQHAQLAAGWLPEVFLSDDSLRDPSNPWHAHGAAECMRWDPRPGDALLLGGIDWQLLDQLGGVPADVPVINLLQGLVHADPTDPRYGFLGRRAVRVCVNPRIEAAVRATGRVRGPLISVPMGLDLVEHGGADDAAGEHVLICSLKAPAMGHAIGERLTASGIACEVLDHLLPRQEFIARMRAARIVVTLPLPAEGYYLPALEAMALGREVVCPDGGGNADYLDPGVNALVPVRDPDAIAEAVRELRAWPAEQRRQLRSRARMTAGARSLLSEREAFHAVLADLPRLWAQAA